MSFYEINLLVSTMLSQEEALTAITGIESKIEKYGKAISEKTIDKKKLAYSIRKEAEAWLIYFNFSPAKELNKKEVLDAVEKLLKEEKNIIRYLIVKKEEPKPVKERASKRNSEKKLEEVQTKIEEFETQAENVSPKKVEEPESPLAEPKRKVQLEELDELLDQE